MIPEPPNVLICPLDWGLGHASRVIPVVHRFIACGYRVILAGSGKSGELLQKSFPDLSFITIPSKVIHYSRRNSFLIISLLLQLPGMIYSAFREHYLLRKIVKLYNIQIVVSDNRYGLYSKQTHNIFITHQVSPLLPSPFRWAEYPLYLVIRTLIHRFNECWIPDYSDTYNLSGKLAHRFRLPLNARFVGILSRFNDSVENSHIPSKLTYNLVVVLSGPQPQLEAFTRIVISQVNPIPLRTLIITGLQESFIPIKYQEESYLTVVSHLNASDFKYVLLNAEIIVCRAGYSGIMDLVALGKTAILVPTPGQTEQQYLAEYLSERGIFRYVNQGELNLKELVSEHHKMKAQKVFRINERLDLPVEHYLTKKITTITENPNK